MATSTASSRKSKTHKVTIFFQYVENVFFVKRAGHLQMYIEYRCIYQIAYGTFGICTFTSAWMI